MKVKNATARIGFSICLAVFAIISFSCANPLSPANRRGKASLALSVRLPVLPWASKGPSSRVLIANTVSIEVQLLRSGAMLREASATADAEGVFTVRMDEIEVGAYTLRILARDANGVYAESESEIRLESDESQVSAVLFPTAAVSLNAGENENLGIDSGRTGIYSFQAPYSGTWTISLSGAPADIQVFGNDGRTLASYSGGAKINLPALSAGDRAYIAVYAGEIARNISAGAARSVTSAVNPDFGVGGLGTALGLVTNSTDVIEDMVELPDGRIVAVGTSGPLNENNQAFVAVFTSDLRLDANFGGSGRVFIDAFAGGSEALSCALQTIGTTTRIIVAGRYFADPNYHYFVGRFRLDGSLDTGFGPNDDGYWTITTTNVDTTDNSCIAPDCAVDSQRRILVSMNNTNANPYFRIVRLSENGTLDTGFGEGGMAVSSISDMCPVTLALSLDGSIFIAGHNFTNIDDTWYISKLSPDGQAVLYGNFDCFPGLIGNDTQTLFWNSEDWTVGDMVISSASGTEAVYVSGTRRTDLLADYASLAVIRADTGAPLYTSGIFSGGSYCSLGPSGNVGTSLAVDNNGGILISGNTPGTFGDIQTCTGIKISVSEGTPAIDANSGFNLSVDHRSLTNYTHDYEYYEACNKTLLRNHGINNGDYLFGGRTVVEKGGSSYSDLLLFDCPDSGAPISIARHHPLRGQKMIFHANLCLNDGSVIAVGEMEYQAIAAKFTADGRLDTSFGANGLYIVEGSQITPSMFYAVALAPNEEVIAAGKQYTGAADFHAFAQSLSAETGGTGTYWAETNWIANFNAYEFRSLCFASDGMAIFGANYSPPTVYYRRLLAVDSSGALLTTLPISNDGDHPDGICAVIDGSDRILAAHESNTSVNIAYTRWDGGQFTDTTMPGTQIITPEGSPQSPKVYFSDDGSYYVLVRNYVGSSYIPHVQKHSPTRQLIWGHSSSAVSSAEASLAGAIHPDGRFFVAGSSASPGNATAAFISSITPEGNGDPTFGTDGTVSYRAPGGGDTAFTNLRINAIGDIIASGYAYYRGNRQGLTVNYR